MQYLTVKEAENLNYIKNILNQNDLGYVRQIERLPGGFRSMAFQADNLVIRFPKTEIIWLNMQREKEIIDKIHPQLPPVFVEKIHQVYLISGNIPFSVSQKFEGKICDNREESKYSTLYENLNHEQKDILAYDLAQFFGFIHNLDYKMMNVPPINEAADNWNITEQVDFDYNSAKALLLKYSESKINLDDYKTEINKFSALCHNDLSGSNLLITPEKQSVLCGIIDFGNALIGPTYNDFVPLYKINRQLAADTLKIYNKTAAYPVEQKLTDYLVLAYIGYCLSKKQKESGSFLTNLMRPFL